jgi:WD40 repeat protein
MLYNLDAIRDTAITPSPLAMSDNGHSNGNTLMNSSSSFMEAVPLKSRSGRSSSLPAGIFHVAQRPETNQLAVTTLGTEAHILRLQEIEEESEEDVGVDMMDVEDGGQEEGNRNQNTSTGTKNTSGNKNGKNKWQLDVEYNLEGHTGGCPTVRICNNKAVTASFDGRIRVFELPPINNNSNSNDVAPLTTAATAANNRLGNNTNNNNHSTINNGCTHLPEALYPISTFMDDPEHSQQPPLNEQNRGVCGIALSSSADRIVSGSNDMQIKVWDTSTGRITLRLGGCMGWPWWVEGLDPELNAVTSASTDGFVRVWDLKSGQQSLALNLSSNPADSIFPVAGVVPRVDGNYLVAGCFDKSIYVIDRRMGRVVKDLRGHSDRLARMALRGDSLLSSAFNGQVGLWDF